MDTLTPTERSERMSRVRAKNTGPEMIVRRMVHRLGYRFRLHRAELPGRPDLVFARRRRVIFVHGCFWHQHDDPDCKLARLPKSRREYWLPKLERNIARDAEALTALATAGWGALVLWECELNDVAMLAQRIHQFLGRKSERADSEDS